MEFEDELMPRDAYLSGPSELSDEDLEHYLLGRTLAGVQLTRVEEHLRRCPLCAKRAARMTDSLAALIKVLQQFEREEAGCPR